MDLPNSVKIVEVGPRDGLQNEPEAVPTAVKLEFIQRLADSGLQYIEATSFVSPQWVPQMSDHTTIMQALAQDTTTHYPALVPNLKGMQQAIECGVREIAVFTAASETFSQKNTNCSIDQSLERIAEVINLAKQHNITVRGYVSCVLGCPYEGDISGEKVREVAEELIRLGVYEISLGDTIGMGTPLKAQQLIANVSRHISIAKIAVHFHDTYGQALANILACLQMGVSIVDSAAGGLGGCPYAPGASGNVATEDVLYMLNGLNVDTGVDLKKLSEASHYIHQYLNRQPRSKVANVYGNSTK